MPINVLNRRRFNQSAGALATVAAGTGTSHSATADSDSGGLPNNGWELTAAMVGLEGLDIDPGDLPLYVGTTNITSNTTIADKLISDKLDMNIGVGETCTISRCYFDGGGEVNASYDTTFEGTLVIEDCLFDSGVRGENEDYAYYNVISNAYPSGGTVNVYRSVIRGWGRGGWCDSDGRWEHCVYEMGTWFGNPATTGSHNEAITHRDTGTVEFYACRLDCSEYDGAPSGQQNLSAVVQIQGNESEAGNLSLENCYLVLPQNLLGQPHIVADVHAPGTITNDSIDVINCRFTHNSSSYSIDGADIGTWSGNSRYLSSNPPNYNGTAIT